LDTADLRRWLCLQIQLCESATPGPWEVWGQSGVRTVATMIGVRKDGELRKDAGKQEAILWDLYSSRRRLPNYRFCAAARSGYPAALGVVGAVLDLYDTPPPPDASGRAVLEMLFERTCKALRECK
jgi:hypothetical protein